MVSMRNLVLAASALVGLTTAAPAVKETRQTFVPGTLNNTREFYIGMVVTDGLTKYTGWKLQAYHTGAGLADPVFVPTSDSASRAYLNGTQLQFDVSPYPFSANGFPSDTNYARWEPVTISSGYGSGAWVNNGPDGLEIDNEEFGGWLVCEWFHGCNAPQLFQMIKGFDTGAECTAYDVPSSCARVLLFPGFI